MKKGSHSIRWSVVWGLAVIVALCHRKANAAPGTASAFVGREGGAAGWIPTNPIEWGIAHGVFGLEGGAGWIQGQEGYRIGGNVTLADGRSGRLHFPISELLFSYRAPIGVLRASMELPTVLRIVGTVQSSLADGTGDVEDRDWLFTPRRVDIESRSDNETSLWMADLALHIPIPSRLPVAWTIRGGYRYESFDHQVTNLRQWYPIRPDMGEDRVSGLVATYETRYHIPYAGVGWEWGTNMVSDVPIHVHFVGHLEGLAVLMTDEDQHLLRDKETESVMTGFGISAGGELRLVVAERLTAGLSGSFCSIRASGRQKQYALVRGRRYLIGEIDSENEHDRWMLIGWIGIRF